MNTDTDDRMSLPSASAASRWMVCPGSHRAELAVSDTASSAAERGSLIHAALVDESITLTEPDDIDQWVTARTLLKKVRKDAFGDALRPVDVVRERRYWLLDYREIPICSARVDYFETIGDVGLIVDFKFGRSEVEPADQNKQLLVQAVCVASHAPNVERMITAIIQPHASPQVTMAEFDRSGLYLAHQAVTSAARSAMIGETRKAGPHCRWCRARSRCEAAQQMVVSALDTPITPERIGGLLTVAPAIRSTLDDIERAAHQLLLNGATVPGHRLTDCLPSVAHLDKAVGKDRVKDVVPDLVESQVTSTRRSIPRKTDVAKIRERLAALEVSPDTIKRITTEVTHEN